MNVSNIKDNTSYWFSCRQHEIALIWKIL